MFMLWLLYCLSIPSDHKRCVLGPNYLIIFVPDLIQSGSFTAKSIQFLYIFLLEV